MCRRGVELHGEASISTRSTRVTPISLAVRNKDIIRVKEELSLPSSKPNIGEILWDSVELRGADVRVQEGLSGYRGELFLFLLYEADGEKKSREWMEASLPFQQSLECSGASPRQLPDVEVSLLSVHLEAVPDYDGEERNIQAEAVLNVNIRLYEEDHGGDFKRCLHPGKGAASGLPGRRPTRAWPSEISPNAGQLTGSG